MWVVFQSDGPLWRNGVKETEETVTKMEISSVSVRCVRVRPTGSRQTTGEVDEMSGQIRDPQHLQRGPREKMEIQLGVSNLNKI